MYYLQVLFGILGLGVFASVQGAGQSARAPEATKATEKLQGVWKLKTPQKDHYLWLCFTRDHLDITNAVTSGGKVMVRGREGFGGMVLKEQGNKQVITFRDKASDLSEITARFEGDTLVIEKGECNLFDQLRQTGDCRAISLQGEWQRPGGDLAKLQGEWQPLKPQEAGIVSLKFDMELLQVCARSRDKFGCETVLFDLLERNKKQVIAPAGKVDWITGITYQLDGETLTIEDGACNVFGQQVLKGKWKYVPQDRKRVP